jgi:uncharacterized protein (TIGR03435 family)
VTPLPAFEVASIKPSKSDDQHSDTSFDNGCFTSTNISLKVLIQHDAFGIVRRRLLEARNGLPRIDIVAKVDSALIDKMQTHSHDDRNQRGDRQITDRG